MFIYMVAILSYFIAGACIGIILFQTFFTKDVFSNAQQAVTSYEYQDVLSALIATEVLESE